MSEQEQRQIDLDKWEADLDERERELDKKTEVNKRRLRDNLYDRITISVKTMNIVVAVISILLVVFIIAGIVMGAK